MESYKGVPFNSKCGWSEGEYPNLQWEFIDEKCIPFIHFFNKIGLQTEFSCEGHEGANHDFTIIFHDSVTDESIAALLKKIRSIKEGTYGTFYKWMRYYNGGIHSNWMYNVECPSGYVYRSTQIDEDLRVFQAAYNMVDPFVESLKSLAELGCLPREGAL